MPRDEGRSVPARVPFSPGSNQRDSEAAGLHTTAHCLTLIPRRRVPARGASARKELRWEERPNGQCVLCAVPEAFLHANSAAVRAALAISFAGSAGDSVTCLHAPVRAAASAQQGRSDLKRQSANNPECIRGLVAVCRGGSATCLLASRASASAVCSDSPLVERGGRLGGGGRRGSRVQPCA